jgi:hypothetical protein
MLDFFLLKIISLTFLSNPLVNFRERIGNEKYSLGVFWIVVDLLLLTEKIVDHY